MNNYSTSDLLYNENLLEDHGQNVNPSFAVFTCSIGLAVAVLSFCLPFCVDACVPQKRHPHNKNDKDIVYVSSFLHTGSFVVAMILLLIYSVRLRERDNQDYQGAMRITDLIGFVERQESNYNSATKTTEYEKYYDAVIRLDWGYEWACPHHRHHYSINEEGKYSQDDFVVCNESTLHVCSTKICDRRKCKSKQKDTARQAVEACAIQYYFDPSQASDYTAYDPFVGPSHDTNWPNLIAFGNCETCQVSHDVPSRKNLQGLHIAGLVFLSLAGLSLLGTCVSSIMVFRDNKDPTTSTVVSVEMAHTPYQSHNNSLEDDGTVGTLDVNNAFETIRLDD